jgi:hypothetical protein
MEIPLIMMGARIFVRFSNILSVRLDNQSISIIVIQIYADIQNKLKLNLSQFKRLNLKMKFLSR